MNDFYTSNFILINFNPLILYCIFLLIVLLYSVTKNKPVNPGK